jgi:hypothetical protein
MLLTCHLRKIIATTFALGAVCACVHANAAVLSVSDSAGFQRAIHSAAEGDIVELAAGTYSAPAGAFTLYSPTAGFTVRAASGAAVTLTGSGSTDILRFTNSAKPITFESLTFANGVSTDNFIGATVTIDHAQANFKSCSFQNNSANAPITGGGLWLNEADASFQGCVWTGNTSPNYGAALSAINSKVFIINSQFTNNRSNVPNHKGNSAGGAVFLTGGAGNSPSPYTRSIVRISNCTFDSNRTGYAGGAIYTLGEWQAPDNVPVVDLTVSNCLFTGNAAEKDPSVSFASPTVGGAMHFEDQTTANVYNCRFVGNWAKQGGAVSTFRAKTNFEGCLFTGNIAVGTDAGESVGGAVIVQSADAVEPSTNQGQTNRPSAVLTMTDCLIQGDGSTRNARDAGGLFVSGDLNAQYGLNGIKPDPASNNRATAVLTRVAFDRLVTAATGGMPGTSGAFQMDFATLTMDSSMVTNCSTSDFGGGGEFVRNSVATITNSTFAGNNAGQLGGALLSFGCTVNLNHDNLVDNSVTRGNGAAMTSAPQTAAPGYFPEDQQVLGLVQNCIISNNRGGAAIYDGDRGAAPFNLLQYGNNQFFPGDNTAFTNDYAGTKTVDQLNSLTVRASGVKKAPSANTALTSAATVGQILLLPPQRYISGGPGEKPPTPVYVAYAASGDRVSIDGSAQKTQSGVAGPTNDIVHTLTVGSQTFQTVLRPSVALNISTRLPVGSGENALIAGFIIGPQSSVPKRVLIRAIGPSLAGSLPGTLPNPSLQLTDQTGATVASNDDWRTTVVGGVIPAAQSVEIEGTGAAPLVDAESALIATLDPYPQRYTAIVRGVGNTTGTAVVEVYDLDPVQKSQLANISTRGLLKTADDLLIGGFIYQGGLGATNVVIRALGPSLKQSGIANPLANPTLEIHNSNGTIVAANDDWKRSPDAATLQRLNFQPSDDAESAILRTALARDSYTAVVRSSKTGGTGVALVEVYVF